MSVIICKNITSEGPGTIEDFLIAKRIPHTIVDLSSGEVIPDASAYGTLVLMGGPISVNDEKKYPYLTGEMLLIESFLKEGKRVLGICLGAQLMAKALDAKVYPGAEKEIGWYEVELTEDGINDKRMSLLADGSKSCNVFQWHGETFDMPAGTYRLAGSRLYHNQAFRYGKDAYAFQFHIEVTEEMIFNWMKDEPVDKLQLMKQTSENFKDYLARANNFFEAFFL